MVHFFCEYKFGKIPSSLDFSFTGCPVVLACHEIWEIYSNFFHHIYATLLDSCNIFKNSCNFENVRNRRIRLVIANL